MDGMKNLLMTYRDMTTRDWLVDAAVALAAFAVGCLQLMLTASSIIIPDLALRQYLGVVNVVPDLQVFVGLGMTVVPLVLRRRFPLPVFAACLVILLGLQVRFSGFSMTVRWWRSIPWRPNAAPCPASRAARRRCCRCCSPARPCRRPAWCFSRASRISLSW